MGVTAEFHHFFIFLLIVKKQNRSLYQKVNGGFLFRQQIVLNRIGGRGGVERPVVLLDFQCNYTKRYIVSSALIPKNV